MKITLSELKQIIRQEVRNARLLREEKTKPSVSDKKQNFIFTLSNGTTCTLPKTDFREGTNVQDLMGKMQTWGYAESEKDLRTKLKSANALKETRFLNSRAGRLLRENPTEEELGMAEVNEDLIDKLKEVLSDNYDSYVDDKTILLSSIKKTFNEIYPNDVGLNDYLSSINELNSVTSEEYSVSSYNNKWKNDIMNAHDLPFTQDKKEQIIEDFESIYKDINKGIREPQDRRTLKSVKYMGNLLYSYIASEYSLFETKFNDENVELFLQRIINEAHRKISERKKRRFRNI